MSKVDSFQAYKLLHYIFFPKPNGRCEPAEPHRCKGQQSVDPSWVHEHLVNRQFGKVQASRRSSNLPLACPWSPQDEEYRRRGPGGDAGNRHSDEEEAESRSKFTRMYIIFLLLVHES